MTDTDYAPSPTDLHVVHCPTDPAVGLPLYSCRSVFTRLEAVGDLRSGVYPEGMVFRTEGAYWTVIGKHTLWECDRNGKRLRNARRMCALGRSLEVYATELR
jgi:hypothetical protein